MLSRHLAITGAVALGWLAALPASAQDANVAGSWSLSGKDRGGRFRGTAALTQAPDAKVEGSLTLEYVRWSWSSMSYRPTGRTGSARVRAEVRGQRVVGRRYTTTGLTDVLGDLSSAQSFPISYTIARNEDGTLKSVGGRFDGNQGEDRLTNHRPSGPTPPPPSGPDRIELPARLLAVPGTPEAGRQTFDVVVSGAAATLSLQGPGRLLREGAPLASNDLQPGTHRLQVEGTGDGRVTVTLRRGSTEAARATSESAVERLYAILMGYQGAEVDYLDGDTTKAIDNIAPRLQGYARVEDGKSYDQSKIDQALADPTNPRRLLVDWCVTSEDLFRYMNRGTLRGLVWGSHGFMEPFPGCPDAELDIFESRVWSAVAGAPETGDRKNFMRDWRVALERSQRTHGELDFVLMHSCCTGGIGSYAPEVWKYINAETKGRCEAVLGSPLPEADRLRYASYDALDPFTSFLQTYDGPSYFGMWDVSWGPLRNAIRPTR